MSVFATTAGSTAAVADAFVAAYNEARVPDTRPAKDR